MNPYQELGKPEEWMQWASCAEVDPEAFFPEKGGTTQPAKRICGGCAVQAECLEFAIRNGEQHGIWGGLSSRERAALTRSDPTQHERGKLTPAELRARIRELHGDNYSDRRIADALGCADRTVLRIRQELDLPAVDADVRRERGAA